jgi:ABC-type transport system involved in multi-copper enzyme maturation permease subunit
MNANETLLIPSRVRGWSMGLANMLAKENTAWWRTRRWWLVCLVTLVLLNGNIWLNARGDIRIERNGVVFLEMAAMVVSIVAISLGQDAILGERHAGTAAWVLSKPLRRPAYILAKLGAHSLGLLATGIVLPGAVAYYQLAAYGWRDLSPAGFAGALGLAYLNVLFYLTLAVMLATLVNGRGPVLGITLLVLMSGMMQFLLRPILNHAPWLTKVMPWMLVTGIDSKPSLGASLAVGDPLLTVAPIIATVLWCVLFTGVAMWRMRREEF